MTSALLLNNTSAPVLFRRVISELGSSKYNISIKSLALGWIMMTLQYIIKSAIFESAVFALASIMGYIIVYRWFQTSEEQRKM
ncbi:MAG TPA: hypothetical protein VJ695_07320 [Nitrososphaera sp.]|nr:hypothetical protein [Nitrososphaera sp.]